MASLIFVDVEANFNSPCPGIGLGMTCFGAVEFATRKTFYGTPDPGGWANAKEFDDVEGDLDPADSGWRPTFEAFDKWLSQFSGQKIFVSDNPAYDWQWINFWFWNTIGRNPFGHSARRIGDFYAGVVRNWRRASDWKRFRVTPHTHHPVDDAMGNVESFEKILKLLEEEG